MTILTDRLSALCVTSTVAVLTAISGSSALATPLVISDVPLFLTTGAEPNVMLMIDSSGSMRNIVPDAPYSATNTYSCPSDRRLRTDLQVDLFIASSGSYAGIPYFRRPGTGGSAYERIGYDWGTSSGSGATNKAKRCFDPAASYLARLHANASGPDDRGTRNDDDDIATGTNYPDEYLPARYTGNYLNWFFGTNAGAGYVYGNRAFTFGSGARYKQNTQFRLAIAKKAGKSLVSSMDAGMRVGLAKYNGNNGGALLETVSTLNAAKKSSLSSKVDAIAAAGNTPLGETLSDIGYYFSRGATDLTLHPTSATKKKDVSHSDVFDNGYTRDSSWNGGTSPIEFSCQKSFAVLLTDGRPQEDQSISSHLGDYDGDCAGASPACLTFDRKPGQEYESAGSDYLNDVAMGLYDMDLRPDLISALGVKNNVATYLISFADDQAINDPLMPDTALKGGGEFFVAGNEAQLVAAFESAIDAISKQPASVASASVNSGSISSSTSIYQAKFDSTDWSGQLLSFRINTGIRAIDGAAAVEGTLGAQQWDAATRIPVAADRKIITVNPGGKGAAFRWAALDPVRQKQIDPTFIADVTLGTARLNYLRGDPAKEKPSGQFRARPTTKLGDIIGSSPIFVGPPRFPYRDNLESEPYSAFRRDHSDTDGTGSDTGRTQVVYAGANDGMLHAFDAASGTELLAFVPGAVYPNLPALSDPNYAHKYFVDGSPNMGDVFIAPENGAKKWQTVLLGGLNKGGQGLYALNITDPSTFSEGKAADIVMWEFTDTDAAGDGITGDADLGYTYSQPAIVRLQNGDWGAIFGNGYNNTAADGSVSATGNAALYIVNIATGKLIAKFDTLVGSADDPKELDRPNGLSTPAVVDINADSKVDYVFAGDLFGNLWKFDIRGDTPGKWQIAYGTDADPLPLFSARDPDDATLAQPITSRPEVIRGPKGVGMMVLFGTGKYLEAGDALVDKDAPELQTYYGLFDRNSGEDTDRIEKLTELQQQEITLEDSFAFNGKDVGVRVTTQKSLGSFDGWYLNLKSPQAAGGYKGERQVSNTTVRAGRVIFTTLIPDDDPCGLGGASWLMELDALSGGRLATTPFDLNNDGIFDEKDFVTADGEQGPIPVSGVQPDGGITPTPGILLSADGTKEYKYSPGANGSMNVTVENPGEAASGRQSWRQVR